MIIAPQQFFGLGDVIFCISIARKWIAEGHDVVWGVAPQFVDGLSYAYPDIKFVNFKELPIDYTKRKEHNCVVDDTAYRVVPLRWSVEHCNVPYKDCMKSKYMMFKMDCRRT